MTDSYEKLGMLAMGKAKTMYLTNDPDMLIMEFRDDISAGDGAKTAQLDDKGWVNNMINAHIMKRLISRGVPTHFVKTLSKRDSLVKRLRMLNIECVVRNITAGSICRRLGVPEREYFDPPIFEFFLKYDELHDPLINESHILSFQWATYDEIVAMKKLTLKVNEILRELFNDGGLLLVDFKLEFGWHDGIFMLGDEFSPDGCRLWDRETMEVFDKDRFRKDFGNVVEFYKEVARRLEVDL